MKPIDPAAEGALDDPASTYADCRTAVERGLAELQVSSLPLSHITSAGPLLNDAELQHIECCLLAAADVQFCACQQL